MHKRTCILCIISCAILIFTSVSCSQATPAATTAAASNLPGQIHGVVFDDKNGSGTQDPGETGIQDTIGFIAGPCSGKTPNWIQTNADGTYALRDLKSGEYCVAYGGNRASYSRASNDVKLNPGDDVTINFAVRGD